MTVDHETLLAAWRDGKTDLQPVRDKMGVPDAPRSRTAIAVSARTPAALARMSDGARRRRRA